MRKRDEEGGRGLTAIPFLPQPLHRRHRQCMELLKILSRLSDILLQTSPLTVTLFTVTVLAVPKPFINKTYSDINSVPMTFFVSLSIENEVMSSTRPHAKFDCLVTVRVRNKSNRNFQCGMSSTQKYLFVLDLLRSSFSVTTAVTNGLISKVVIEGQSEIV